MSSIALSSLCENFSKSSDKMQEEPFQLSKFGGMYTHRHIFLNGIQILFYQPQP